PSYVKTGEADYLLSSLPDVALMESIIYIGKHNVLPKGIRGLTNGDCVESYHNGVDLGQANIQFLQRAVKHQFMSQYRQHIHYARQVAFFCKVCGEYKATGMFEFIRKDKSYTEQINFTEDHIIDPARTGFKEVKNRNDPGTRKVVHCVPCGSSNKKNFENRYEGIYASAREYFFTESFLERLVKDGRPLPKVTSVRIRVKEPASETEKLAFIISGGKEKDSEHFQLLRDNRESLEAELGKETISLLLSEGNQAIYDKFGLRLL
ncbi:unnamed protein product, partial [marine sediment metagenome]